MPEEIKRIENQINPENLEVDLNEREINTMFSDIENKTAEQKKQIQWLIIQKYFNESPGDKSSRAIKKYAKEYCGQFWPWFENNWNGYTSQLAGDPENKFTRIEGTYNYILGETKENIIIEDSTELEELEASALKVEEGDENTSTAINSTNQAEATTDLLESTKRKREEKEKNLYPCLVEWLKGKKYLAKDTSALRNGEKWGNPDITGLKVINSIIGNDRIEICTIEAKPDLRDWRQYIFEAISHKRFANRTYFAFAVGAEKPEEGLIKDREAMRQYAEKYKIGIIAIFMETEDYRNLAKINDLSLNDVVILELWPAIYDETSPSDADEFCRIQLNLNKKEDVYTFGR